MTARIIQRKRIYCERCGNYFKLDVKKEKMCSGSLLTLICNYIMFLLVILGFIVGILVLDAYLKTYNAKSHPDSPIPNLNLNATESGIIKWFSSKVDYTQAFSFKLSVRWTDLLPMFLILTVLVLWCFYFHLNRVI